MTGVQVLETLRPVLLLRILAELDVGDAETGLLVAGMSFLLPLIAVPERIAQALYPTMLGAEGEAEGLDRTSGRMLAELAAISVPLLAAVCGLLALVLPAVKGGTWTGTVPVAWALLPGVAAHGLSAHLGYVILVRHRLPLQAGVSAVALAAMAGLAFWLAPLHGAVGAAVALSGALVLRGILVAAVAHAKGRSG
jgi:O-antigen/teichoic acid export membrane protein